MGSGGAGHISFEPDDTVRMTLKTNGNLGIGETNPTEALEIKRNGNDNAKTFK